MVERAQLLKRVLKPRAQVTEHETSSYAKALLDKLNIRRWLAHVETGLIMSLYELKGELRLIEHLPRCQVSRAELAIDVERYLGSRTVWWINLEDNECLEELGAPKLEQYPIDNYWDQVKRYKKTGSTEGGPDTMKFVMARARWAYGMIGKEIGTIRKMLKLVRAWDYTDETEQKFQKLEDKLTLAEAMIYAEA
jgi:hypothetical protein